MSSPDFSAWQQAWAPYARFIPGFAYLQGLAAGGGSACEEGGQPPWASWVAPVLDVDELDRRIRDLQAVHFWLEQNARALQATIQALQVQRMTLAALRSMNVSLQQQMGQAQADEPSKADTSAPAQGGAETAGSGPAVDPVRWWRAVTEQFQTIAAQTMQDLARPAPTPGEAAAAAPAAPAPPASRRPRRSAGAGKTANTTRRARR